MSLIPEFHPAAEGTLTAASRQLYPLRKTFLLYQKEASGLAGVQVYLAVKEVFAAAITTAAFTSKTFPLDHEAFGRVADVYTGSSRFTHGISTLLVH